MKQPHGTPEWEGESLGKGDESQPRERTEKHKKEVKVVALPGPERNETDHPHGHWHSALLHDALASVSACDPPRKPKVLTEME